METENNKTTGANQQSSWFRESPMVKIAVIALLALLLLIPSSWVTSLIEERQTRATEAISEVSQSWSSPQYITGPVLVLPYRKEVITKVTTADKKVIDKIETRIERAFFLPEQLNTESKIEPEALKRGIFDVVVYKSTMLMNGFFKRPDLDALGLKPENIYWNKAYVINGLSDLRGLSKNPAVEFNGATYESEPSDEFDEQGVFSKNFVSHVKIAPTDTLMEFSINFPLKGSSNLNFYPIGKSTNVSIEGTWKDPKFYGFYLPDSRHISDTFSASWNILHFNREFAQQWLNHVPDITQTSFGVNLLMPVDQYQKSIRTAKYGILIILLTFVSLLIIELIVKKHIHPFQYTLIGAALIIYYTLLISISEHLGFNLAYLISSSSVIILISLYSISIFQKTKVSILLSGLLTVFYSYIFIITQQQDFALLLGSIALFIIIATLMYVSRKIDWYNVKRKTNE